MEIIEQLKNIEFLNPLPNIADKIEELLNYPQVNIEDLSELISIDPALTLLLLNYANNTSINLKDSDIDSIDKACFSLDIEDIQDAFISSFHSSRSRNYSSYDGLIWQHAMASAIISAHIAEKIDEDYINLAYTAGLIHDFGKMILIQYFPKRFAQIVKKIKLNEISFWEAERSIPGPTHTEIGKKLARYWNLPSDLVDVIAFHHEPKLAVNNQKLVEIVSYSNIICGKFGIGFGESYNNNFTGNILSNMDINKIEMNSILLCLKDILLD